MRIVHHIPATGTRIIRYCGDTLRFELKVDTPSEGKAWLRTNLGQAAIRRREIIEHVEKQQPILACDWNDIPMREEVAGVFTVELPLTEVGRFEAKAFFMPRDGRIPHWPDGDNIVIKVEPEYTMRGNSVYTAFVRQFGPHMPLSEYPPSHEDRLGQLEKDGYAVIPKSGTFRQLAKQLDHIILTMGFNTIQLLPIHPVPTTYARMGRFGSPFAAIDFFDVDPALAEFDRKTTPLDQFCELADAVHARGARLMIDLPINHTGWASHLQLHHPEWFVRDENRSFVSPGAWGVTWEDLSELDYTHHKLWQYMADVFLFWCRKGVDGFRCDAGYMVPEPVWEYITAKVREEFPDTIFMLEGLGGKISVTEDLLDRANLNWAYSEIFQVYDRMGFEAYLPQALHISMHYGTLINYAETHDNNRLAATSHAYARMRTALAAMLSDCGAFGITNGVEWFATTKVDVHRASPLNWGSAENQVEWIARINHLLNNHPAFAAGTTIQLVQTGGGNVLAVLRTATNGCKLLIAVNLDENSPATVSWPTDIFASANTTVTDLLTNDSHTIVGSEMTSSIKLNPLQIVCLSLRDDNDNTVDNQDYRMVAMRLYRKLGGNSPATLQTPPPDMAKSLRHSPAAFCERIAGLPQAAIITVWQWPHDLQRTVMLPTGHLLLIKAPAPFRAAICYSGDEKRLDVASSLPAEDGSFFAFLDPPTNTEHLRPATLRLTVLQRDSKPQRVSAPLLMLSDGQTPTLRKTLARRDIYESDSYALLTNNRGAYGQVRLEWSRISSQYDCLLGANLNAQVPVDRQIMFTRCRAWLVHRDYSREVTSDCIQHVTVHNNNAVSWLFCVPVGMGKSINMETVLRLIPETNRVTLAFTRSDCANEECRLPTDDPVSLILRPDIEDRNFHEVTKAFAGPEAHWPAAVITSEDGFSFAPSGNHKLEMKLSGGQFVHEAEWYYNIPHPYEAQRGLDKAGDIFSPGYFKATLACDTPVVLSAAASSPDCPLTPRQITAPAESQEPEVSTASLLDALPEAIRAFIVKRDDTRTVIAGYPWFLDWGRDTLICLRGIIAAGMLDEARDILIQFARFEKDGTLPNMIRGNDDSNRDTTDAPLWFFTACADFNRAAPGANILATDCGGGRSLQQVLLSIVEHYINGTPNGIYMDAESALIFSPSHYTWMDTNFPAGTPREGYPIEIQALWYAALTFMAEIDQQNPRWKKIAATVKSSIRELFVLPDRDYLADCLLASPGTPARQAVADNALRPNQLFAITLGAVSDPALCRAIISACEALLVPGAIRSLADQPVSPPLPIYRDGVLLNDPANPYWGYYGDDEDTRRKPAYHNGTAWSWPFPSYCEALYMVGGDALKATARSILSSSELTANSGCIGHIPEIQDGNTPHTQRGCQAQAWGATELYRVLKLIS